jgi:hypothetical protein
MAIRAQIWLLILHVSLHKITPIAPITPFTHITPITPITAFTHFTPFTPFNPIIPTTFYDIEMTSFWEMIQITKTSPHFNVNLIFLSIETFPNLNHYKVPFQINF